MSNRLPQCIYMVSCCGVEREHVIYELMGLIPLGSTVSTLQGVDSEDGLLK